MSRCGTMPRSTCFLEPGEPGSGIVLDTMCSEDVLARSWQRLIFTHLQEAVQPGVLTGSPVTDLRITLVSGKAHLKHTEGGDFRQATYRAVRQGLRKAQSVLLEPWYSFRLELPSSMLGRAMTDFERMHAELSTPELAEERAFSQAQDRFGCCADIRRRSRLIPEGRAKSRISRRATARARSRTRSSKESATTRSAIFCIRRAPSSAATARALRSSGTRSTGWRICRCWISRRSRSRKSRRESSVRLRPAARRSWKKSCWRSSSGRMGRSSGATCFP